MRIDRSVIRAYGAAVLVLVLSAVGFRVLVSQLNIFLMKEPVELRRPLDAIPTSLGRWQRVGSDTIYAETLLEELGTKRYLDRTYAIDGDASKGFIHLHIAYYTGTIDAVPHIPERCWAVGGLLLTRNSERTGLEIDRSGWAPHPEAEGYLVCRVTDEVTAEIETITMPEGDLDVTTIEFQDPKDPKRRQVGGYFFIANGRSVYNSYGVRQAAFNLTDRYAYYCKIQLTMSDRVDDPDGSLLGKFREGAGEFLGELVPHVMRCLPDWPEWEAKSAAATPSAQG